MTVPEPIAPAVRLREITSRSDAALPAAYALLHATFARHERVTLREWRSVLREREEDVWTDFAWHLLVAEQRGEVVGLATGTFIGSVDVAMVGYLAMAPAIRGGGIGTRLRERLRHEFERDARRLGRPLAAIVGEVSHDNPWLRTLARQPKVLVLDMPYYQPSLRFLDTASPFVLYYESCGPVRSSLPMLELRRVLYALWRESYRLSRPLEHRAVRRMLRALDGKRQVGPHPDFPRPTSP